MTTTEAKITEVLIEELEIDPKVSIRFMFTSPEVVERYAEAVDELPPVTVFQVNGTKILTDGFHRVEAHKSMGREKIRAYVLTGTKDEAFAQAIIANTRHGRPLTPPEYREGVIRLLNLGWGQERIAKDMGRALGWVTRIQFGLEVAAEIGGHYVSEAIMEVIYEAGRPMWKPLAKVIADRNYRVADARELAKRCAEDGKFMKRVQQLAKGKLPEDAILLHAEEGANRAPTEPGEPSEPGDPEGEPGELSDEQRAELESVEGELAAQASAEAGGPEQGRSRDTVTGDAAPEAPTVSNRNMALARIRNLDIAGENLRQVDAAECAEWAREEFGKDFDEVKRSLNALCAWIGEFTK